MPFPGKVVQAAAGGDFSVALRSDTDVFTWGANGDGQLGNRTNTDSVTPVQASTPYGITQVAAGWGHAMALRSDGSVWAWGHNRHGQLGDGTTTDSSLPVKIGLSGVTQIDGATRRASRCDLPARSISGARASRATRLSAPQPGLRA